MKDTKSELDRVEHLISKLSNKEQAQSAQTIVDGLRSIDGKLDRLEEKFKALRIP